MPFFPLMTFQEITLAFFLGLGAFILLYVAWGSYPRRGPTETGPRSEKPEGQGLEDRLEAGDNPIPPFLVFVYIGIAVWALAYLIFVGLQGKGY